MRVWYLKNKPYFAYEMRNACRDERERQHNSFSVSMPPKTTTAIECLLKEKHPAFAIKKVARILK